MGKRGPKAKASDTEIMNAILQGRTNADIARSLKVSEWKVTQVRKIIKNPLEIPANLDALKNVIRLEITQENTLTELAEQLKDYTDQYEAAKGRDDEKAAYAWSQNRIKLIDMMAKITGLYNPRGDSKDNALNITVEFVGGYDDSTNSVNSSDDHGKK